MGIMIVFALIGVLLGSLMLGGGGGVFGLLLGGVLGRLLVQAQRIALLERRVQHIELRLETPARSSQSTEAGVEAAGVATEHAEVPDVGTPVQGAEGVDVKPVPVPHVPGAATSSFGTGGLETPRPTAPVARQSEAARQASSTEGREATAGAGGFYRAWQWLTGGNLVAKAGVVVLFFGVAFLVKYAATRNLVPIELRLAGVVFGAMVMLFIGWRLRHRTGPYAVLLQGGAVGILYLTVFASARLYGLLPMGLVFALLVALVVFSAILAVLQDARALAVFGAAGGFLAPILASTGGGSHVALFSYYALLNAGILGIAWFRAWRSLNLLGFVFTFILGAVWGYRFYQPAYFSTVEPFLVLFFVFYVGIAVLFALRQPPRLKGYVDGSLVFGVPLVAFGLQAALVHDIAYAMAWSALGLGLFYLSLATVLWRRGGESVRLLSEAFLALGTGFATLAIPLALDVRWTAAAWSVEGTALVWIGLRQSRLLARCVGLLLQLGAGAGFAAVLLFDVLGVHAGSMLNGDTLGGVLLSLAGLLSSWLFYHYARRLREWESLLHYVLLAWGLLWWFTSAGDMVQRHLGETERFNAMLAVLIVSAGILSELERRVSWRALTSPLCGITPLLLILTGVAWQLPGISHPLWHGGIVVWGGALVLHYALLHRYETRWSPHVVRGWHMLGVWWLTGLLSWEAAWWVADILPAYPVWSAVVWGLAPALLMWAVLHSPARLHWPVLRFEPAYRVYGAGGLGLFVLLWSVHASLSAWGAPAPLRYLPVLNPVDITQGLISVILIHWWVYVGQHANIRTRWFSSSGFFVIGGCTFIWLNAVLARTVHFWLSVPFTPTALHHSVVFQSAVSVLWTLSALGLTTVAARRDARALWFVGAIMLVAVVAKLFIVDLSGTGTVARIVSFIGVGVLMLIIGYLAPLPPRRTEVQP